MYFIGKLKLKKGQNLKHFSAWEDFEERDLDGNLEIASQGDKLRSGKVQVTPSSGSVYSSNLVL